MDRKGPFSIIAKIATIKGKINSYDIIKKWKKISKLQHKQPDGGKIHVLYNKKAYTEYI